MPEALLAWDHASVACIFLAPRARAYYVPAFLRAFLAAPLDGLACAVLEHAVHVWTPPGSRGVEVRRARTGAQESALRGEESRAFQDFADALTREQKAALANALAVLAPPFDEPGLRNPVRAALDACWGDFLTP